MQGAVGHDEAFTATLAIGITVIYSGFLLAATRGERGPGPPGQHRVKSHPEWSDLAQACTGDGRSGQRERPPGEARTESGTRVQAA